MKPIIIIETDGYGNGYLYCNGKVEGFSYDDGDLGDVTSTLKALIRLGAIPADMVKVYTLEEAVATLGAHFDAIKSEASTCSDPFAV